MLFSTVGSGIAILLLGMCCVNPAGAQCYCGGNACRGGTACRSNCLCCGRCPPPPPPSPRPTGTPTSRAPTLTPTSMPTIAPSDNPTDVPTYSPSDIPTAVPTFLPTDLPTNVPTDAPSHSPTCVPTSRPSLYVSQSPTLVLETNPTDIPVDAPVDAQNPEFTNTESSGSGSSMLLYVVVIGLSVLVVVCKVVNIRNRRNVSCPEHTTVESRGKSSSPFEKHVQHASSDGSRSVGVINPMYQTTAESMDMPDENPTYVVPTLSKTWNGEKNSTVNVVPTATIADSDLHGGRGSAPTPVRVFTMR